jgi:hypothetical protein
MRLAVLGGIALIIGAAILTAPVVAYDAVFVVRVTGRVLEQAVGNGVDYVVALGSEEDPNDQRMLVKLRQEFEKLASQRAFMGDPGQDYPLRTVIPFAHGGGVVQQSGEFSVLLGLPWSWTSSCVGIRYGRRSPTPPFGVGWLVLMKGNAVKRVVAISKSATASSESVESDDVLRLDVGEI